MFSVKPKGPYFNMNAQQNDASLIWHNRTTVFPVEFSTLFDYNDDNVFPV